MSVADTSSPLKYRRSGLVRMAGVLLHQAHRVLPQRAYGLLYEFLRSTHRRFVRLTYLTKLVWAQVRGDQGQQVKTRMVYDLLPFTMGGPRALESVFEIVSMVERERLAGALVECGVAQGGCAAAMGVTSRAFAGGRHMWLFDSFEGLPDPTADDFNNGRSGESISPLFRGLCLGTVEQVSELLFKRLGFGRQDVTLVKGWFQDTLPVSRAKVGDVAVLRLDGDWYESTKCCLENLYDTVVGGGFVIIDDYATCYGAERAVHEFLDARGVIVELRPDGRGGAWFRKPPGATLRPVPV